jgi:hypothetical protein
MSGGYALVEDFNPTVYTLDDIAKVTEECFLNMYGTNHMYLPPQNYKTWADDEDQEHSHLAQPTVGQPTVGGPGYKAHKAWADYEDEEIPWNHWGPEDLKAQDSQQDWTEVVHKSRSNASTNTSSTSSSHSGKIANWYGKPVGFNKDGTSYSKKPYGWIETENAIGGSNRFIFFTMPPGAKYGRQVGTTVQFDVEYNDTPIGRCANISHVVCF